MALIPDQQRKREREIKSIARDWEVHTSTLKLRRKIKTGIRSVADKIWSKKYKVKTLYFWVRAYFDTPTMGSFDEPLTHDNLKKPSNMQYTFALQGGWTIPEKDLKTLTHGPLLSQSGVLLVKEGGTLSYYWNKFWPFIASAATVGGLIRFVFCIFGAG